MRPLGPLQTVAVALLAGLAGGYGGRRLAMLHVGEDLADLADVVEQLGKRVARRDGQEGAARRRSAADASAAVHDDLVQAALARRGREPQGSGAGTLDSAREAAIRLFSTSKE